MKLGIQLFGDPECWRFKEMFPEVFASFGCGPGGFGDRLVPDTIWFLSVKPACQNHDWGYRFSPGNSEEDRFRHDRIFLNNMLRIVNAKGGWLTKLRRRRAKIYYDLVRWKGANAYWEERNKPEELRIVTV